MQGWFISKKGKGRVPPSGKPLGFHRLENYDRKRMEYQMSNHGAFGYLPHREANDRPGRGASRAWIYIKRRDHPCGQGP